MTKKKVAIVGSGTGLTLAWLLADQFDVTLYESENRLGGHINSLEIKKDDGSTAVVEGGAEFLNSTYTYFFKLLEVLKVEKKKYMMTMEFIDYTQNDNENGYEKTKFSPNLPDLILNYEDLRSELIEGGVFNLFREMIEDSEKIINLITLNNIISVFNKNKNKMDKTITLEKFLNKLGNEKFGEKFLYPVVGASWGIEPKHAKNFMAHYALNYLSVGSDFYEVIGGLSKYISKLEEQIKDKVKIKLNSSVVKVVKNDNNKYSIIYTKKNYPERIINSDYDEIIVCTSAEIANKILVDVESVKFVCEKLNKVEYYDTTICFHENEDKDINKNVVVHIKYDGRNAATTALKSWNSNIKKTWILNDNDMPNKYYELVKYRHPYMFLSYYNAQECMKEHNKKMNGISFGSIMANMDDSHESGIRASVDVAKKLLKKYSLVDDKISLFNGLDKDNSCCECCC
jgi:hypothetical protein